MTLTVTSDEKTDPADETTEPPADEQTVDLDADTDTETDDAARRQRSWPRRVLVGAGLVIFIAALAISGVLGWKLWQEREVTRAGEQAQQAAIAYAQILTSIDSNKVDENFNQVLDGATGEFKDMYSQSSVQLRQLLIDNKAAAHGVVVESAIQSASKDKVVVLLFVDQSVSNTNVPDPRIDRSRIKMTMEFVDGRWRASQVALP
jgi:Mce-associated membrane protein